MRMDRLAFTSKLKGEDPLEKLFYIVLTLFVCIWADNLLISCMVIIVNIFLSYFKGGLPLSSILKTFKAPLTFLFLGVITVAFEFGNSPDYLWKMEIFGIYVGFHNASLLKATHLFFKALGAVSCLFFLSLNTPFKDILSALERLKLPRLFLDLSELIYRFIFTLLGTADKIYLAQASRQGYGSFVQSYKSMGLLIASVFTKAYKRSDDVYEALLSRGYEGDLKVLQEEYRSNKMVYPLAILFNLFLIVLKMLMEA